MLSLATLVACGSGPIGRSAAATVDGHEITVDELTSLMEAQKRNIQKQSDNPAADPQRVSEALDSITGSGEGTFDMAGAANTLQLMISHRITLDHLEAEGDGVTEEDTEAARSELAGQVGGEEQLDTFDQEFLQFFIDSTAATKALQRISASGDTDREQRLQELFEETAAERPLCLSIIVTETEDAAQAALARVEGGEDFATVATETSVDAQTAESGGFAGCASPDRAAEAFGGDYSTAAVGEIFGPREQQTEQGPIYILVHIDSTTGPTFEQLQFELGQMLSAEDDNRASEALYRIHVEADVDVDPRYGTWDSETGTVTPPAA